MKEKEEMKIKFSPSIIGFIMSIFIVFMGICCFAGYVIMVTEASESKLLFCVGIIGFPLAIFMIFDGFSYMFVKILISNNKITIKRFLRKTVLLDKSKVIYFTDLVALDSGRKGDVRLITIFTKDNNYKIKYNRGLVKNEKELLDSLKELGSGEKLLSKPSVKERFYF